MSVVFETEGTTPLADVIASLRALESLSEDAISLLPSLVKGVKIEDSSVSVAEISQQSPLKELFFVSLVLVFQEDLEAEVPTLLEDLFKINIPSEYDTLAMLAFVVVVFYGIETAKSLAVAVATNTKTKMLFEKLLAELAESTGKPPEEIRNMLHSHFDKPSAAKRLARNAVDFFRPSQADRNAPVVFDRKRVDRECIREVPIAEAIDDDRDFEKYETHSNVTLRIHAQDRDKQATGWAAVLPEVSEKRLRMKVMAPVEPSQVWGKDSVQGDVVVISKAVGDDYVP